MIFSWLQVAAFLLAMGTAGWLLYPDEYMRGRMYRDYNDRSESVALFRSFLAKHPGHKGATLGLVASLEAAGRPDEALEPLLTFYRRRRGDLETGRAALALLDRTQQLERADDFRWELIEDLRVMPAPSRRRIEEVLFEALQRAVAAQDDERALKALGILAGHSADGPSYRDQMVRLLLTRGLLDRALAMLREEVRASPKNGDLRRTIVRIQRARGDVPAALGDVAAALAVLPFHPGLIADRADIFLDGKRWREAEADLRTMMRLEPRNDTWPLELARALVEGGRFADGVAVLQSVLQRDLSDRKRWWDVVYFYTDRKMFAEAVPHLERLLARFPADAEALDALVQGHRELGRTDLAIGLLERRVRGVPGDLERRRTLISLLVEEERLKEAADHVDALLARSPAEAETWLEGAYLRESVGDVAGAVSLLERYLERFPGDDKSLEKLAALYASQGQRKKAIAILKGYFRPAPPPVPGRLP
ncbi:tetratricopeptide repeat protein [bacterium]|nr:MAG: tetratricopeptide repeat protein [bacterium]